MPDEGWLLIEGIDDLGRVIRDLLQRLPGEELGFRPGGFDGFGIVWPVRFHAGVRGPLEDLGPPVPAWGQEPQPVDEDHGHSTGGVSGVDLLALAVSDPGYLDHGRHGDLLAAGRADEGSTAGKGPGRGDRRAHIRHRSVRRPRYAWRSMGT